MTQTHPFRVWETDLDRMVYPPAHPYVISGAGGVVDHRHLAYPLDYPVMFSTGLNDAQDEPIYEKDLLAYIKEGLRKRHLCRWDEELARYVLVDNTDKIHAHLSSALKVEIVGNCYETPEIFENVEAFI